MYFYFPLDPLAMLNYLAMLIKTGTQAVIADKQIHRSWLSWHFEIPACIKVAKGQYNNECRISAHFFLNSQRINAYDAISLQAIQTINPAIESEAAAYDADLINYISTGATLPPLFCVPMIIKVCPFSAACWNKD